MPAGSKHHKLLLLILKSDVVPVHFLSVSCVIATMILLKLFKNQKDLSLIGETKTYKETSIFIIRLSIIYISVVSSVLWNTEIESRIISFPFYAVSLLFETKPSLSYYILMRHLHCILSAHHRMESLYVRYFVFRR